MSNEAAQQQATPQAPAPAPAPTPAPGGDKGSLIPPGTRDKITRAAAAVAAAQAARGEGEEAAPAAQQQAPAPQPGTPAPAQPPAPQAAPQEPQQRPELTRTEYWEHLDQLQAENRTLQSKLKQGTLPDNFGDLPLAERLQAVGIDPRDPQVMDLMLDALQAGVLPGGQQQPQPQQQALPEGVDPAVAAFIQQQQQVTQQLQQRLEQYEQGTQTIQQQLAAERKAAAMKAEEAKFAGVIQASAGRWPTIERALKTGKVGLGFANEVAENMIQQQGGGSVTYDQVLGGIEIYLQEQAKVAASLLGEPQQQPAPAPPLAAQQQQQGSTTLAPADNEPSMRKLTREERVKRAAALVKERQKSRQK